MRALGLIVLAATLAACGDSGTEPTDNDVDLSGRTYALTTFAGASLPYGQISGEECRIGTGADEELELQAVSLSFAATTFTMDWTMRGRCLDTAGDPLGDWVDLSYATTGPYTVDQQDVTLDDVQVNGTWTGSVSGSSLTLTNSVGTATVWSQN
jgi:hypothetical protein